MFLKVSEFQGENLETLKLWHFETLILVGLGRIELPTSPLSGVRSSQLSYRPGFPIVLLRAQRKSALSYQPSAVSLGHTN